MSRNDRKHTRPAVALLAAVVITGAFAFSILVARAEGAQPPWSVVASPSPQHGANGGLAGVLCRTSTSCLVVGEGPIDDVSEIAPAIAGEFKPSGWTPVQAAFPNGSPVTDGALAAVACAAATKCFAVGGSLGAPNQTLIERWDGSWRPVTSPNPPKGQSIFLNGVACPTKSLCFAVGGYTDGSRRKTLIERWNGAGWSIVPSPNPHGTTAQASLAGIACPAPNACYAVGTSGVNKLTGTLIEAWNGSSWSIVSSPNPTTGGKYELFDISCPMAANCFAVGRSIVGTKHASLALRWNGAAWSIVKNAIPGNTASLELFGVACVAIGNCFAVGYSGSNELIARWNGAGWTRFPTLTHGALGAISCLSATQCVAVGGGRRALVILWDGKQWSISRTGGSTSRLADVSCGTPTDCLAVGQSTDTLPSPLVERWDGSSWSEVGNPPLASDALYYFRSTSCLASGSCFIVGVRTVSTPSNGNAPLALEWTGTTWEVLDVPVLPGTFGELSDISCPSSTSCFAVGRVYANANSTLVEHWDGAQWSRMTSPNRAVTYNSLWSISCVSTSSCWAVGNSSSSTSSSTLIERWNGTAWSIVASPNQANSASDLEHISCATSTSCAAVGSSSTSSAVTPLFESWNGAKWTIVPMGALPAGASYPRFNDLSCASTANCVAVGRYGVPYSDRTLVERWNGSKWTFEVSPAVGEGARHLGVTCSAGGGCVAVGSSTTLGSDFTLVEKSAQ